MKLPLYIIAAIVLIIACNKEEALTASGNSLAYSVPQGNNPYDTLIVGFYKKYGTYLLYKFTDKDAYWTPTGWKNSVYDSTTTRWSAGFLVKPAEEQYVSRQLQVINNLWFRFYPDGFLKQFLPVKILLCSSVDSIYQDFDYSTVPTTVRRKDKFVAAWYNYDNISVNFGNTNVTSMTARDSGIFVWKTNLLFMQHIIARKPILATDAFIKVTSYVTTFASQAAAYENGSISSYYSATAQNDWNEFMMAMVTCSETLLNAATPNNIKSYNGILNPTKDKNGKIRQRYNMVRNYFINNYQVDLQQIGNAAIVQ